MAKTATVLLEFITKGSSKVVAELGKLDHEVTKFTSGHGIIDTIGEQMGEFLGPAGLIEGAHAAIEAFHEAEQATLKLEGAVEAFGGTQADANAIMEETAKLQKETNQEGDAANAIIAEAINKGLSAADVQKNLNGMYGLAAGVFNGELGPAMDLYTKAMQGQTDRLGMQLPALKTYLSTLGDVSPQEKATKATEWLTKTYGGLAQKQADAATIAKHEWGDMVEEIGRGLKEVENEALGAVVHLGIIDFGKEMVQGFVGGIRIMGIEAAGFFEELKIYADYGWKGVLLIGAQAMEKFIQYFEWPLTQIAKLMGVDFSLATPLKHAREEIEKSIPGMKEKLETQRELTAELVEEVGEQEKVTREIEGQTKVIEDNTKATKDNTLSKAMAFDQEMRNSRAKLFNEALKNQQGYEKELTQLTRDAALKRVENDAAATGELKAQYLEEDYQAEIQNSLLTSDAKNALDNLYEQKRKDLHKATEDAIQAQTIAGWTNVFNTIQGPLQGFLDIMGDGFMSIGKLFDGLIKSITAKLAEFLASYAVQALISWLVPGAAPLASFGSAIGKFFGFKAEGGDIPSGGWAFAGESGIEAVQSLPGGGTRIIPMTGWRGAYVPPGGRIGTEHRGGRSNRFGGGGLGTGDAGDMGGAGGSVQINNFSGPNIHTVRSEMMTLDHDYLHDASKFNGRRRY